MGAKTFVIFYLNKKCLKKYQPTTLTGLIKISNNKKLFLNKNLMPFIEKQNLLVYL